jgi:hypothetical protein
MFYATFALYVDPTGQNLCRFVVSFVLVHTIKYPPNCAHIISRNHNVVVFGTFAHTQWFYSKNSLKLDIIFHRWQVTNALRGWNKK